MKPIFHHTAEYLAAALTERQQDGLACVVCGADYTCVDVRAVPVGPMRGGGQVFACVGCARPADEEGARVVGTPGGDQDEATALVPGTWPAGEPAAVRQAEDEKGAQIVSTLGADRPSWQTSPCPSWCDWGHQEHDHYDDRLHTGESRAVVLTAVEDSHVDIDDEPDEARMYLRQHYGRPSLRGRQRPDRDRWTVPGPHRSRSRPGGRDRP